MSHNYVAKIAILIPSKTLEIVLLNTQINNTCSNLMPKVTKQVNNSFHDLVLNVFLIFFSENNEQSSHCMSCLFRM